MVRTQEGESSLEVGLAYHFQQVRQVLQENPCRAYLLVVGNLGDGQVECCQLRNSGPRVPYLAEDWDLLGPAVVAWDLRNLGVVQHWGVLVVLEACLVVLDHP